MSDESWKAGYDTLKKQMGALQGQTDVYKRRSPLEASTHIDNIAKSLAKDYGITSIGDIGVRYETRPAYETGSDESRTVIPEEQLPVYYNKSNPNQIIPGYKFASEGRGDGYSNYNLQPVQQADGSTIVVPIQQYSKSGMGAFVEDLGPIIQVASLVAMAAGAPPLYLAAGNLALQGAAGNIDDFNDALRVAAPYLIPAGLQGLDVVGPSLAATTAGRIAENYGGFAGLTGIGADIAGGALSNAVKAGLTGDDILSSALSGAVAPAISAAGKYVTSGIKDAFGGLTGFNYGADLNDMGGSALEGFGPTTTDTNAGTVNLTGAGADDIFGNLTDDELNDLYGSTVPNTGAVTSGVTLGSINSKAITDSSVNTMAGAGSSADELQSLYELENPGASSVDPEVASMVTIGGKEYLLDNKGGASTLNADGTYTNLNATQFAALGDPDVISTTNALDNVTVTGKKDVNTSGLTTTPAVDPNLLSTLTSLTQINPLGSSQVAALTSDDLKALSTAQVATIDTKTTGALDTSQIAATNTSQIAATNTSQIAAITTGQLRSLTSSQIASLVLTTGTGLLLTDITKGGGTPATTGNVTTLSTSQVGAVTTGQTALSTSQVGAITTMGAQGLQGIADPTLRYWNQTGRAGTGGQGGVRFFDWTTNPVPVMGGSNMEAAKSLIPAFTSAQAQAMVAPTAKQYFNAATNRYYTDPTGQWTPPAGWTQKTFKDGGEVETKHFDGGGSIFDFDTGIDIAANNDYLNLFDMPASIDFATQLASANDVLDNYATNYLQGLPSDNASYGDIDRTASYQQDIKDAANASGSLSGVAKTVVDKLAGMGAKLTESALRSITNNPGAWLSALAGAGLGYAASKNNTVSPMGLQGLGLSQQQVYNTLKGGNYVGRAMGGEIPGYGAGGGLHYLKSAEDGMADKIPATIDSKQPARLSGGEFVIPADVVSHLGNGNSEAGAKRLYEMMDKIRHARTGTKEQGKQINPAKFTPK